MSYNSAVFEESLLFLETSTGYKNLKQKGIFSVPKVQIGENESLEGALKRLKKKMEREGTLKILKARKHYEKPSEKRRRKQRTSKKRKPGRF